MHITARDKLFRADRFSAGGWQGLKRPARAKMVRVVRIELTLPKERVFETRASTNSATPARISL